MPARSIRVFAGGLVPRTDKRLLQDDQAQIATNARITSGALQPLRGVLDVYTSSKAGALLSAHRLTASDGQDVWLAWTADVDAVKAPLSNDTGQRVYFTGDGEPKVTWLSAANALADNRYPNTVYVLGVPRPATAPTVGTVTGGSGNTETRAYRYTFVSRTTQPDGSVLQEEGRPSPIASQTGFINGTWPISGLPTSVNNSNTITGKTHASGVTTVSGTSSAYLRAGESVIANSATYVITEITGSATFKVADPTNSFPSSGTWTRAAPHNDANMVKRLYRTYQGLEYQVADVAMATTTYNDNLAFDALPGPTLQSAAYEMPPVDLKALISLPNGCLAGISGNRLCLSEPYQPHAWPSGYQYPADYPGVSLGSLGTSVVMTTTGTHYVATGTDPSAYAFERASTSYPCVSKRGTVSMPAGVCWPTHHGLALQSPGGVAIITEGLFKRDEWQAINPATLFAETYDGRYVGVFQRTGSSVQQVMLLDPSDRAALFEATVQADGLYADVRNGALYVLRASRVQQWDAGTRLQMDWQSKEFVEAAPMNWGAAKVDVVFSQTNEEVDNLIALREAAKVANETISATDHGWKGGEIAGAALCELAVSEIPLPNLPSIVYEECGFYLYANNRPVHYERVESDRPFRCPAGFLADNHSVRVVANVTIRGIVLGTNVQSLRGA
jgi:hypothetical protein